MTPLHKHTLSAYDVAAVHTVLRSERLTQGQANSDFAAELEHRENCHAEVTCNGTAALMAAYHACGVRPGDHVLVPAITYVGTANAAKMLGAEVEYVDSLLGCAHICPGDLSRKIRYDTKLVVGMDYAGISAKHGLIKKVLPERCRYVVDAAHSFGALNDALHFADAVALSFHPSKTITSGEGGAVLTRHHDIMEEAYLFAENGRFLTRNTGVGLNLRMSDIHAALGRSQLNRIDEILAERKKVADHYWEHLDATLICAGSYHLAVIQHRDRDSIARELRRQGISTGIHYPCLDNSCANAARFSRECLSLPIYPGLDLKEVERICEIVNEFYKEER